MGEGHWAEGGARGRFWGMGILSWWFAVVLCFLFILRRGEVHPLLHTLTTMMSDLSSQSQVTMRRILLAVLLFYLYKAA